MNRLHVSVDSELFAIPAVRSHAGRHRAEQHMFNIEVACLHGTLRPGQNGRISRALKRLAQLSVLVALANALEVRGMPMSPQLEALLDLCDELIPECMLLAIDNHFGLLTGSAVYDSTSSDPPEYDGHSRAAGGTGRCFMWRRCFE